MPNNLKGLITLLALPIALTVAACAGVPAPTQTTPGPYPTKVAAPESLVGLAFNPGDASLLKTDAAGLSGLAPEGQTWEAIKTPAASGLQMIALNPDDPNTLYVSGPGVGVLKSTDGGQSWGEVNTGLPNAEVSALAIHSFRRETLYAWLQDDGIYRTEDGGAHWNRMPDQGPPDADVRGLTHSTLPGSMNTGWLYASTPSGAYLSMDCF